MTDSWEGKAAEMTDIQTSQKCTGDLGSIMTYLRCSEMFSDQFIENLMESSHTYSYDNIKTIMSNEFKEYSSVIHKMHCLIYNLHHLLPSLLK